MTAGGDFTVAPMLDLMAAQAAAFATASLLALLALVTLVLKVWVERRFAD